MKKTKILAVALTASLLAVPLTACGEGAEYKPADYAISIQSEELASFMPNTNHYSNVKEVTGRIVSMEDNSDPYNAFTLDAAKLKKANNNYVLYDLAKEQNLLNGKEYTAIDYNENAHLIELTDASDPDNIKTTLCTVTGDEFLSAGVYEDLDYNSVKGYLNGSWEEITVYSVTYTTENASKETTKYYTFDVKTKKTTVVSSSEFRTTAIELTAGTASNVLEVQGIYDNAKENPLSGYAFAMEVGNYAENPIFDATYTATFTAYKDGAVAGSVSMENGAILGAVGNYMYYYEVALLPQSATSGYNVEYQENTNGVISTMKFDCTLYRYDIVKGGDPKEVKADYLFAEKLSPLYNNTAKSYDKANVDAYEFTKGVALISEEVAASDLIVDDTLAVSYNQTGKPYSAANLIQLKDNRYFAYGKDYSTGYILDENLNAIANLPMPQRIYPDQQLIVCRFNGKYMAVDFDGKVVFEPKYSALSFYGDYAKADVTEKSGKVNDNMIVSKTNPEGKSLKDLFTDFGNEGISYVANSSGYILKTAVTGTTDPVTAYSLYNYKGEKIVDLGSGLNGLPQFTTLNGKLLATVSKMDGSDLVYTTYIVSGS